MKGVFTIFKKAVYPLSTTLGMEQFKKLDKSGYYKIKEVKSEIIVIEHDNGSIVEAFKKELRFY